jgi:hypothetical protein
MGYIRLSCREHKRYYEFDMDTCVDVMSSLKIDKDGRYVSVKAVFSDGVIRYVYLNKRQTSYYLKGEAVVAGYYWVQGYVDTTHMAKKHTNAGFIFYPKHTDANADMLPQWVIPGWEMPIRVKDIR